MVQLEALRSFEPPGDARRWNVLGAIGRVAVTLALLTGLFIVDRAWATGVTYESAQRHLHRQFESTLAEPAGPAAVRASVPPPADAVARIQIPAIGVDQIVLEGVDLGTLARGPGHYPGSALPGQPGNTALAGHRTTHGAPFGRIDELDAGDAVITTTSAGRFVYRVTEQRVVRPDALAVIGSTPDSRLTLTTCNPEFSARERLVVIAGREGTPPASPREYDEIGRAVLASTTAPQPVETPGPAQADHRLAAATAIAAVCGAAWWVGWRKRPGVLTWVAGAAPFALALHFFFDRVERVLPANL